MTKLILSILFLFASISAFSQGTDIQGFKSVTGTTYTILNSDRDKIIVVSNVAGCTITMDDAINTGYRFNFWKPATAGTLTFVSDGTSTLESNAVTMEGSGDVRIASWVKSSSVNFRGYGELGTPSGGSQDLQSVFDFGTEATIGDASIKLKNDRWYIKATAEGAFDSLYVNLEETSGASMGSVKGDGGAYMSAYAQDGGGSAVGIGASDGTNNTSGGFQTFTGVNTTSTVSVNSTSNGYTGLSVADGYIGMQIDLPTSPGLVFLNDHSANYTIRSVVDKGYIDTRFAALTVPTLAQVLTSGNSAGTKITNLTDPTNPQEAATKAYADTKAALASPTFTGTPAAPTAAPGTSTTQLATTAFVAAAVTGGSVADGDKGDITVSGTGSVWTIDNLAVTSAKIATMSSANLRTILTDESGTGVSYFQGGDIGTPSAGVGTNLTGLPISTGLSGGATNRIPYFTSATALSTSGAPIFDGTNLGIGATPQSVLTASGQSTIQAPVSGSTAQFVGVDGAPLRITFDTHNNANASGTALMVRRSRGTAGTPSALSANDVIAAFSGRGYGASQYAAASTGLVNIKANQTFTNTANGTYISFDVTPDNSVTAAEAFRFGPSGQFGIGGATYGTAGNIFISGGASAAPSWLSTGTGVNTWLTTPSWTNFSSAITGTAPYWSLASGGTLTGSNTITSNANGQLNFAGTYTTTANNQFYGSISPVITSRATASDAIGVLNFGGTYTATANNQTFTDITVNSTVVPGAFSGINHSALTANGYIQVTSPTTVSYDAILTTPSSFTGLRFRQSTTDAGYVISYGSTASGLTASAIEVRTSRAAGGIFFSTAAAVPAVRISSSQLTYFGGNVDANSTVQVAGSMSVGYVAKSANYTLTISDYIVEVTANSPTITLPTAVGITGRVYIIDNSGAGTVTMATTSSQTIDGIAPATVLTGTKLKVYSNGANWRTF